MLNKELGLLKKRVFDVKEELFVKNMKIRDLDNMEEVAEVAVNRCRRRLVYLQNKVEKRKEMLEKVKDTLANLKVSDMNEDYENMIQRSQTRKSEIGKNINAIKSHQRNMDKKMKGLLTNIEDKASRLVNVDQKLMDEKRRLVNAEQNIERER